MTAAHLHANGLAKRFGDREVLHDVDLFAQGGIIAVLGANGAGKTTLLRCLATLLLPDDGAVAIDGLDTRRDAERIEIRRRLGYLPQDVRFDLDATVFGIVDYIAVLKEIDNDRTRRRLVFDALDRVGLRDRSVERIDQLSGGMRQRVGLAQAIVGSPTLLILDEPAAGLDPDERLRLREVIAERRRSATVVVSTHLTDEAAVCDTVLVLADGTIAFAGTPAQLAAAAEGRTWVQPGPADPAVRASWLQADGRARCLGTPPADAELVPPSLEDGYLLVQDGAPLTRDAG